MLSLTLFCLHGLFFIYYDFRICVFMGSVRVSLSLNIICVSRFILLLVFCLVFFSFSISFLLFWLICPFILLYILSWKRETWNWIDMEIWSGRNKRMKKKTRIYYIKIFLIEILHSILEFTVFLNFSLYTYYQYSILTSYSLTLLYSKWVNLGLPAHVWM